MSEVKSISKDQLEKIQDFQKELNKLLNEPGYLEAQKTAVLAKFHEVNKQTEDFKKELEEEYGSLNINLEDNTTFTTVGGAGSEGLAVVTDENGLIDPSLIPYEFVESSAGADDAGKGVFLDAAG